MSEAIESILKCFFDGTLELWILIFYTFLEAKVTLDTLETEKEILVIRTRIGFFPFHVISID